MPIYEYECQTCHEITTITENSNKVKSFIKCEHCDCEAKKIISKSTFILNGTGWAKDGYSGKANV